MPKFDLQCLDSEVISWAAKKPHQLDRNLKNVAPTAGKINQFPRHQSQEHEGMKDSQEVSRKQREQSHANKMID